MSLPLPRTGCNTFSTPDTQPGFWNVTKTASHGNSYLGLVTRGDLGPYANNNEAAQIQLNSMLIAGKAYNYSIDLALSETQGHDIGWDGFLSYANPTVLKIGGGANDCEKTELLWESPAINHTDWQTYDFTITSQSRQIKYIILEANYTVLPSYFGNILIDNLVEKDIPEPSIGNCSLETFNVFTPNSDGYNDVFLFKAVTNVARFNLKICNRWGHVLFETNDLTQGWDGKTQGSECSAGVYFWYTEFICINGDQILDNKMKGTVTLLKY
jgi:gliding motility-associated-like protein